MIMRCKRVMLEGLRSSRAARCWDRWGIVVGGILLPIAIALALIAYIMPGW